MRLTIIGASGHGKVVAEIAKLNGYDEIVFLDDNTSVGFCEGYPVIGTSDKKVDGDVFVAVGDSVVRERISKGRKLVTLIHPSAIIAESVKIGAGTVVMPGAVINPGSVIGQGCIINTSSVVDHDCSLGNYVHIAVGAKLCGTVSVESQTWIGAGATVINNVKICGGCMIGAGAVVINNIAEKGTYVGVPAKKV